VRTMRCNNLFSLVGAGFLPCKHFQPLLLHPSHRFTNFGSPEIGKGMLTSPTTQVHVQSNNHKWKYTHAGDVKESTPRRPFGRFITAFFRVIIGYVTKYIMKVRNKTFLHDERDHLKYVLPENRPADMGILTYSNHQSIMDDPGIWCGILPITKLTLDAMRTIVITEEWYYALGRFSANIFRGLNCLPVKRGDIRG